MIAHQFFLLVYDTLITSTQCVTKLNIKFEYGNPVTTRILNSIA